MEFRVKEICKEKGVKIKDLCAELGISDVALRKSLSTNPTVGTLEKIAKVLNVDVLELFAPAEDVRIICPHCGKVIHIKAELPNVKTK
jgi:transcriptional regulator with XRE-family HTH domain